MTDIMIIAALTACHKGNGESECEKCPYVVTRGCMDILGEDALDLIKRQQIEIEKVKSEAVREFAEKLKVEDFDRCIDVIYEGSGEVKRTEIRRVLFNKQIDNLVKEMGCNDG